MKKLIDFEKGEISSYMPASRDLSEQQHRLWLILQWMHDNGPAEGAGAFHESERKHKSRYFLDKHGIIYR